MRTCGVFIIIVNLLGAQLLATPESDRCEVYFTLGSSEITPEAERVISDIVTRLSRESLESVLVIGHADRVGASAYNFELSADRAHAVLLRIRRGLRRRDIAYKAVGLGNFQLPYPTLPNVPEPLNRCVIIANQ
jgi:OmpA-OmpF porin, OOP family